MNIKNKNRLIFFLKFCFVIVFSSPPILIFGFEESAYVGTILLFIFAILISEEAFRLEKPKKEDLK